MGYRYISKDNLLQLLMENISVSISCYVCTPDGFVSLFHLQFWSTSKRWSERLISFTQFPDFWFDSLSSSRMGGYYILSQFVNKKFLIFAMAIEQIFKTTFTTLQDTSQTSMANIAITSPLPFPQLLCVLHIKVRCLLNSAICTTQSVLSFSDPSSSPNCQM